MSHVRGSSCSSRSFAEPCRSSPWWWAVQPVRSRSGWGWTCFREAPMRSCAMMPPAPRARVGLAQTPQGFIRAALLDAHARALRKREEGTDDAMLVEAAGYSVAVVEGEMENFKITTPEDLRRAEQIMAERVGSGQRAVLDPGKGVAP